MTNRFTSTQKYAANVVAKRNGLNQGTLNKYVQFQLKFVFYYPYSVPPKYTFKSINITRFIVFYRNCPRIVYNLARYENVSAAREEKRIVESEGSCIENAEPADEKGKLIRFCDAQAKATFFGVCACSKGYEEVDNKCVGRFIYCHVSRTF